MIEPPRSEMFDDVYFSAQDGMAETHHVFLNGNDLPARWDKCERFTIAETGFGTGLNFLTCWKLFDEKAPKSAFLDYVSIEKYPLTSHQIKSYLSPWGQQLGAYIEKLCMHYPIRSAGFHRIVFDNRVALTLVFDDVTDALSQISACVNAWFLDGFTPAKNPDMWTQDIFQNMARLSAAQATCATFTAAGFVKRGLSDVGFEMHKTRGFGYKRDMLKGYYKGTGKTFDPIKKYNKIGIIGGGLAGTACAYIMKQYGFDPVIYEREQTIATQASGNMRGLYNPRFTARRNAESDFYAAAFAQLVRTIKHTPNIDSLSCGSLHLMMNDDKHKRFSYTSENWKWMQEHMCVVSAENASDIAGVRINYAALYLADSGFLSPHKLCMAYSEGIKTKTLSNVDSLENIEADAYVLCNGLGVQDFFSELPLYTVRGQITATHMNAKTQKLKTNVCFGGYMSAPMANIHVVGASFQRWLSHSNTQEEDNYDNLKKLEQVIPNFSGLQVQSARASLRCVSRDRFPIIGHIKDNIYISTAHGSHGIISSLMGAHLISDQLRGGVRCLPAHSESVLSPRRYITS